MEPLITINQKTIILCLMQQAGASLEELERVSAAMMTWTRPQAARKIEEFQRVLQSKQAA